MWFWGYAHEQLERDLGPYRAYSLGGVKWTDRQTSAIQCDKHYLMGIAGC